MNEILKPLTDLASRATGLSQPEKAVLNNAAKSIDEALSIATIKIQQVEKDKMTLAELLQGTSVELEQKRKLVEAQNRELEIEAALERIRSSAMAMRSSSDLFSVADVLHKQLSHFGKKELESSIIHLYHDQLPDFEAWYSYRPLNNSAGELIRDHMFVPKDACSWTKEVMAKYQSESVSYTIESRGDMLTGWYKVLEKYAPATVDHDSAGNMIVPDVLYYHFSKFSGGALLMISDQVPDEEAYNLQVRAAKVFELAYRRYKDLEQAELQAREARIEAALERVRTKTMAMHTSQDVGNTVKVMFEELMRLEVSSNMRSGIIILHDPKRMEVWTASAAPNGIIHLLKGYVDMMIHPLLQGAYKAWKNKEATYKYELIEEDLKNYYKALSASPEYPFLLDINLLPPKQVCSVFFFPEGALFAFTPDHLSLEATQIFTRFTGVFALTYRRFQDLQKAEAQAKEAVRQASLDRVRAEIASMRTTSDLERITPLIWKELTILKVPFIRCGVFIMNEKEEHINVYLSTPDGNAIAAFQLALQSEGLNPNVLNHWKNNQILIDHWDEATFLQWTKKLVEHGALQSNEKYVTEKAPSNLYLHFLPFLQGMLYVGNTAPLSEDEIKLVQSLANAFSTAYARYDDFNKLEMAKQQLENTLKELRSTQQQLIQSEKMASLGELTAGIAHEIQNPLNFVNNFSEVNRELIEELKSERVRINRERDEQMEDEILNDISQNLLKILQHGKRADAIVKGMLQHSRSNAGQKELTNINALADEFLRLSYHGLRAKDKSFNAIMETNFDNSIGKINIVPQDMGRVLLNLFNNAFYAVTEKKKRLGEGFEPKVTVTTKRTKNKIEIVVKDNGNGISAKIIDKIFQPFFTTKSAGQGTGLGLSLSYDIVTKEHNGRLKVESEEGIGATFIVQLPLTIKSSKP